LIVASAARLLFSLGLDLHPDEAYYWMWSRFLDLSYYDQGPGVAFYIRPFTELAGNTLFALRLSAAVASLGVLWAVFLAARELSLSRFQSLLAVASAFFIPGFFGGAMLIMHDSVLLLCWTFALYLMIRYLKRRETLILYLFFAVVGLGGLAKYSMVFFAFTFVLWLLFSRSEWRFLKNFHFYAGAFVAALIVLPVLIWNYRHNWDGFTAIIHLRSAGGRDAGSPKPAEYLIGQLMAVSPVWCLAFIVAAFKYGIDRIRTFLLLPRMISLLSRPFPRLLSHLSATEPVFDGAESDRSAWRFVLINALILPLFFLFLSQTKIIQANWVFPSYPAMILILARLYKPANRLFRFSFVFGALFVVALDVYVVASPSVARQIEQRRGTTLPSYSIPYYRANGYRQILEEVDAVRNERDPEAGFAANRYQDAAIASFYLPHQPYVPSINALQRNQYSYWPALETGKNYFILYIQENPDDNSCVLIEPFLSQMFERVERYPDRQIVIDGRVVKRYRLWYASHYVHAWDHLLVEYMKESAIFDIMPNLRGRPDARKSSGQAIVIPVEKTRPGGDGKLRSDANGNSMQITEELIRDILFSGKESNLRELCR